MIKRQINKSRVIFLKIFIGLSLFNLDIFMCYTLMYTTTAAHCTGKFNYFLILRQYVCENYIKSISYKKI